MEESAQRRERLKAMRMEASQETATYNYGSEHSGLSNPLLESAAIPEGQVQSYGQNFNYYTNPMAAFSGNKQRSKVSPQISQDYSSTPPRSWTKEAFASPALQPHLNHSPDPTLQQPQGQYANANYAYTSNAPQSGNFRSPSFDFQGRSWQSDSPRPGGYLGSGRVGYPSPGPHFSNTPGCGSGQGGYASPQPYFSNGPGRGSGQGGYPSPGPSPHFSNSPGHGSGRGYPSPGPHFGNSPNHGPGQGGYPSSGPSQGKGHWYGNSMNSGPSSGRDRGRWPGQGGGGRGQGRGRGGAHNHVSAEDRPDLFYKKSMVEDPWKLLEPVIWKSHKKPWLPNSLSTKKARVSESPRQQQRQSSSQPSLAEILAASFNEAANNEPQLGGG